MRRKSKTWAQRNSEGRKINAAPPEKSLSSSRFTVWAFGWLRALNLTFKENPFYSSCRWKKKSPKNLAFCLSPFTVIIFRLCFAETEMALPYSSCVHKFVTTLFVFRCTKLTRDEKWERNESSALNGRNGGVSGWVVHEWRISQILSSSNRRKSRNIRTIPWRSGKQRRRKYDWSHKIKCLNKEARDELGSLAISRFIDTASSRAVEGNCASFKRTS